MDAAESSRASALARERQAAQALRDRLGDTPEFFLVDPGVREAVLEALTAPPPLRVLQVLAGDREVGWLVDARDIWLFLYDPSWVSSPEAFDLAPALSRENRAFLDGATQRPVQWFFDNLLPEEDLRTVLARDAGLEAPDAFGLLRYYGGESAGALVLRPLGTLPPEAGLRALSREDLHLRIARRLHEPLTHRAPKRMSLAGAQHKMVLVVEGDSLHEPLPGTPSTHILKPNHLSDHYPSSVANEYFVMRLARAMGLTVPNVRRIYTPEPAYVVERFDRSVALTPAGGAQPEVERFHIIDACQLLGMSRAFKYSRAGLETLGQALTHVRSRAKARRQPFEWLVFNLLVGNADNHLKNLSFLVSSQGVELAPAYDLLSTAVYETRVYAGEEAAWPNSNLAFPLPGASKFSEVTGEGLVKAGRTLGIAPATAQRVLATQLQRIEPLAQQLLETVEAEYQEETARHPFAAAAADASSRAGELQLLRAIRYSVIRDMRNQLARTAF